MQPSASRTHTPYWPQLANVTSSSYHQCHPPEPPDIELRKSQHHPLQPQAATLSSEDLNFTSEWYASRIIQKKALRPSHRGVRNPSSRPETINNITREELTSHNECDIKNENQEEIELTLSGHHHVPRHQIVYNIFGQPHLECLENTSSEEWDHHEECSEGKWHHEPPHHECWDQEQHHEWHQDNQQEEEQQGWHHRQVTS